MSYSNYRNIKSVVKRFNLDVKMLRLFDGIKPQAPSLWLEETLAVIEFMPPTNEKAK